MNDKATKIVPAEVPKQTPEQGCSVLTATDDGWNVTTDEIFR